MAYLDLARATYRETVREKSLIYSERALAIQLRLANSQPKNTAWKLALANVYRALGFAQPGLGWEDPYPGTTKRAEDAIRNALQDADPKNPQWRHDLVAINLRFADMFWRNGHTTNLHGSLRNAFDQIKGINFADYSPEWQHEFALDLGRIAVVAQDKPYERAIQTYKAVLESDVSDMRSQVDLVAAYIRHSDIFGESRRFHPVDVLEPLGEGLRYLQMQSAKAPANPAWLYYQLQLYQHLGALQEDPLRARLGGYSDGAGPRGEAIRKEAQKASDATFAKMLVVIQKLVDMHSKSAVSAK